MAMFSRAVTSSVGRTSLYLITAAGAAGMVSNSQYKSMKSLFGNTSAVPSPTLSSPFEHSLSAPLSNKGHNHNHHRRIKFIASTEHGSQDLRHSRRRPAGPHIHGSGSGLHPKSLHGSRRGVSSIGSKKRSVFPRHGVV
ncbi:hypothetical protein TWF694_009849 [Orbilia ellipsospora]|uniref:Ribosomal protein L2 n=1 Tax=Orbilia ellipsospora TaxID=2528407 RepID=A0AAV9XIH2_9PEZI